jgi:hypothetical protein
VTVSAGKISEYPAFTVAIDYCTHLIHRGLSVNTVVIMLGAMLCTCTAFTLARECCVEAVISEAHVFTYFFDCTALVSSGAVMLAAVHTVSAALTVVIIKHCRQFG